MSDSIRRPLRAPGPKYRTASQFVSREDLVRRQTTVALAVVILLLIVVVGWAATPYLLDGFGNMLADPSAASQGAWLSDNPAFVGNSSKIDYPSDYGALANFTLGVINQERAAASLNPVVLSSVPSGQQHADSMVYYGYFSHWDNQGYKPYMRYTLLGGTGSVSENAALNYCTKSPPDSARPIAARCSLQTIEKAINGSEWMMMNNDSACCNNGHRANILDPLHDRVSVGIAYNSTTIFLVEDFENSYIGSESLRLSAGVVTLQGSMLEEGRGWMRSITGSEIAV